VSAPATERVTQLWRAPPAPMLRAVTGWRHQVPVRSPVSWAALVAGLRSATSGTRAAQAEDRVVGLLRERYVANEVLLTESGTTALTAALLAALHDRPGAPPLVAMPAYACYDLATVADGAGVRVFLYDVDPHTLAPDIAQVEAAVRQGAGVVVVAHLYGYPLDLHEISRLAAAAGAVLIEDAAQVAGATLNGRVAGTSGSLVVLSFGRGKGLTGGSGGALLARDDVGVSLLQRARALLDPPRRGWREVMTTSAQLLLEHPSLYAIPAALPFLRLGQTIYRAPRPLRAPAAAASAMIAATWTLADREVDVRRRNAARLLEAVEEQPHLATIRAAAHARPGYLRLPLIASAGGRRAAGELRARRLGVMPGYPKALCDLEGFGARCLNREAAFPGARALAERLCTLPTHGRLEARDLGRLEAWIREHGRRSPHQ
jgi:dTDP-4-amino-4,6-dideoxygalactose transaminase